VGVFVEEMVLDLPGIVETQAIGELDLVERLVKQPVLVSGFPRLRQLELVKDAKSHGFTFARIFSPSSIIFDGGGEWLDVRPSDVATGGRVRSRS
jgi:hypothetical protein